MRTTRFVDQASILAEAGRGGKGCRSFYQDRWTRHAIPDGGDGGRGGHVLVRANPQLTTLLDFQAKRHFRAGHGGNASSKKQHGAQGTDCRINVPLGTLLWDADTGELIQELLKPGDEMLIARGGAGGVGNASKERSRSTSSWAPSRDIRLLEPGKLDGAAGERRRLRLELKLLADVGIVGLPNAGKSTLIAQISQARPKIAPFPFTTIHPVLGAVTLPSKNSVVAVDVPGLIEGAHRGKGLGLEFLRHIERTTLLVHLIDMAGADGRDPVEDYETLNRELKLYDPAVAAKRQILAANKMDEPAAAKNLARFKKKIKGTVLPISAKTGEGVPKLLKKIGEVIARLEEPKQSRDPSFPRKRESDPRFSEDDIGI
ncbi:MAG: GTPase ObgE [Candidatus Omnitrophica bacterium]|nr:GTPase ObgE [Candidatus Omnitrophota bacterium]